MNTFARNITIASIISAAAGLSLALSGVSVHAGLSLTTLGVLLAAFRGPRKAPGNRKTSQTPPA